MSSFLLQIQHGRDRWNSNLHPKYRYHHYCMVRHHMDSPLISLVINRIISNEIEKEEMKRMDFRKNHLICNENIYSKWKHKTISLCLNLWVLTKLKIIWNLKLLIKHGCCYVSSGFSFLPSTFATIFNYWIHLSQNGLHNFGFLKDISS